QPYRACKGPASHANEEPASVAIGTAAAIVRANLTGPATASRRCRFIPRFTRIVRMLITPAFAQAAGGGDTNSMLMSLLPFALIFVIMYFLILRPQQKKVKDHAELVKNIRRGDTVVTSGGLVGKVTKVVDDDEIRRTLRDAKIGYTGLAVRNDAVVVRISRDTDVPNALAKLRELSQPLGGLLGSSGQRSVEVSDAGSGLIRITVPQAAITERIRQTIEQSIQIVERRVNQLGTVEPVIQRQGTDRILVQVPGLQDPSRLKELLGKTAKMEFRMV